jgi:hypothetical protein
MGSPKLRAVHLRSLRNAIRWTYASRLAWDTIFSSDTEYCLVFAPKDRLEWIDSQPLLLAGRSGAAKTLGDVAGMNKHLCDNNPVYWRVVAVVEGKESKVLRATLLGARR